MGNSLGSIQDLPIQQPEPPPPRTSSPSLGDGPVSEMKDSPYQQGDDDSECANAVESVVQLPEDILYHTHALMPFKDAARAACVSRGFLRSWRCYPNLLLTTSTLHINEDTSNRNEVTRAFVSRVNDIMEHHAGSGLRSFQLAVYPCCNIPPTYVDRWLEIAIQPGVQHFGLHMFRGSQIKYNFPCSLLSSKRGRFIQSFYLGYCSFHYGAQIGRMSSLTSLDLSSVAITGEELCCFLSNSCTLQSLHLSSCNEIIFLKISCMLLKLTSVMVSCCKKLNMIDSSAPKLSDFSYEGFPIHISLGDALEVKKVDLICHSEPGTLYYASCKLPSIAPNLQTLYLLTHREMVNTPMAAGKFLQLKHLEIEIFTPICSSDYDFYSLVSFIDASPTLRTFILRIDQSVLRHDSILEDPSNGDTWHPRCLSNYCHNRLKDVMITGFCSAKSLIELTNHILLKTSSLECLTLDTTRGYDKRSVEGERLLMSTYALLEAKRASLAIRKYVEGRVPSTVNLKVIKPCSK